MKYIEDRKWVAWVREIHASYICSGRNSGAEPYHATPLQVDERLREEGRRV